MRGQRLTIFSFLRNTTAKVLGPHLNHGARVRCAASGVRFPVYSEIKTAAAQGLHRYYGAVLRCAAVGLALLVVLRETPRLYSGHISTMLQWVDARPALLTYIIIYIFFISWFYMLKRIFYSFEREKTAAVQGPHLNHGAVVRCAANSFDFCNFVYFIS